MPHMIMELLMTGFIHVFVLLGSVLHIVSPPPVLWRVPSIACCMHCPLLIFSIVYLYIQHIYKRPRTQERNIYIMEDKIEKKITTIINLINYQTGVTEECIGIYDIRK